MRIIGPQLVSGKVKVSGAKNSILPIICSSLLVKGRVVLDNVPNLNDVHILVQIIKGLGRNVKFENGRIEMEPIVSYQYESNVSELSEKIRYSVLLLGALTTTIKKVCLPFPGGCNFSSRPIDIHLDGLRELGAIITEDINNINSVSDGLSGNILNLKFPSVGATENLIIAAVLAKGNTVLNNVAREPEILDLINFLNNAGAKIRIENPTTIIIDGVSELTRDITYTIMPDRIEAATFAVMGALCSEEYLLIEDFVVDNNLRFLNILQQVGVNYEIISSNLLKVYASPNLNSIEIKTGVYPMLPTDIQPILAVLLTQAKGTSIIIDNVYNTRFQYSEYLNKMGANIVPIENGIIIHGKTELMGNDVYSTDLRGGAAVLIASLIALGESSINNTYQIYRGYSELHEKLNLLGVKFNSAEIEEVGNYV